MTFDCGGVSSPKDDAACRAEYKGCSFDSGSSACICDITGSFSGGNDTCTCANYILTNSESKISCTADCGDLYKPSATNKECLAECPEEEFIDATNKACVTSCPKKVGVDAKTCIDADTCPENSTETTSGTKYCKCNDGYTANNTTLKCDKNDGGDGGDGDNTDNTDDPKDPKASPAAIAALVMALIAVVAAVSAAAFVVLKQRKAAVAERESLTTTEV